MPISTVIRWKCAAARWHGPLPSTTVVVSGSSTFVLASLSVAIGRGAAFVLIARLTRSLTTTVVLETV